MSSNKPEYKPTEDDILKMLHYLRLNLPDYATPENALTLLKQYQGHFEALQKLHPEELENVMNNLEGN